jgi:hypothetical protein
MPQDHYVAQTYLKAFADPVTVKDPKKGGKIHAYSKRDLKHFTPLSIAICKTLDWDLNPKYLSPPDLLGQWLKIFEPHWAGAVGRLERDHHLSPADKCVISGYWAYLSTCTPTWQRVTARIQQSDLDGVQLQKFIAHVEAHPEQYPKAEAYLPLVKDGSLVAEIDKDYPKAIVTKQLAEHQRLLYHQEWNIIQNGTDELFLTSDNPSCFDYLYGTQFHPARYLPLTPRLALWANIEMGEVPPIDGNTLPARKSAGRKATVKFVRDMNVLVIQSAENLILSSQHKAYIPDCVKKYRDWRVFKADPIRIPDADGYYEVVQTRAAKNA